MIDASIKPIVGMVVKNNRNELRTIQEIHPDHKSECPSGSTQYGIAGDHIWFTVHTYMTFQDFYTLCTLVSSPESIIKIIDKETKTRLDLITD